MIQDIFRKIDPIDDYSTYPVDYYNEYVDKFCDEHKVSKKDQILLLDLRSSQATIKEQQEIVRFHLKNIHGIILPECLDEHILKIISDLELTVINCCSVVKSHGSVIERTWNNVDSTKSSQVYLNFKIWFKTVG